MTPEQRFTKIENFLSTVAEHQAKHAEEMRELREADKDLRQMHKSLIVAVGKIADAQRVTDEKLNALIETVDRIIRSRNGKDAL